MDFQTKMLLGTFAVTVLLGLIIVPILRKLKVGQIERTDGPQSHLKKQGTPTMGGIIMILTMMILVTGTYIFLIYNNQIDIANKLLPILLLTIGFGLIGFIDDLRKEAELDGIECFHPSSADDNKKDILVDYARKNNLYISGGSDYHGSPKPDIEVGVGRGNLNISKEIIEEWIR